jgi:polyhydroxyalkanoate synthesis regulator phasin
VQEVTHAELVRCLKVEQAKELTKLRQEFELQARELGSKCDKRMKLLRDDLELQRKQEVHEVEERKVRT